MGERSRCREDLENRFRAEPGSGATKSQRREDHPQAACSPAYRSMRRISKAAHERTSRDPIVYFLVLGRGASRAHSFDGFGNAPFLTHQDMHPSI